MTKQELYLSIYQIIGSFHNLARLDGVTDYDRNLSVNVSRNSNGNISHISMEFIGMRSRFLCSIIFDGNGDQDTCVTNFAMPKVKLNSRQRALACLVCLQFLVDHKVIKADMEYFFERIVQENRSSHQGITAQYYDLRRISWAYYNEHPELLRMASCDPVPASLTQSFTF